MTIMQTIQINHPALWHATMPKTDENSHKYNRGYAVIQGGFPITGAAKLAAMAAARIGAGITAIVSPEHAFAIYASQLLSIMVKPYANAQAHHAMLQDPRINAFLIGPGAGNSTDTLNTLRVMLETGKPMVIDADAITCLNGEHVLLHRAMTIGIVLTPHEGEFARLFGVKPAQVMDARVQQTQEAAIASGAIVLLKGRNTVIASPEGRVIINQDAPSILATAGSGDVLAGMITGLLAQGMPAFEAAAAASWIHSQAAQTFGLGLIADDLPGLIPPVLQLLFNETSFDCERGNDAHV